MPECIYCGVQKAENEFNKEHVLPRAFGSFQSAPTLAVPRRYRVCSICNTQLGRDLDLGLARDSHEGFLRAHRGMVDKESLRKYAYDRIQITLPPGHPQAPMLLRLVPNSGGPGMRTAPMAQIKIAVDGQHPVCIPEKRIATELPIQLRRGRPSRVELFWWAGDPDAPKRLRERALEAGLPSTSWSPIPDDGRPLIETIEATVTTTIDSVTARAIAKIALEFFYWVAETAAPQLINPDLLDPIRRLIVTGDEDWRNLVKPSNDAVLANESENVRRATGHLLALRWPMRVGMPILVEISLFNDISYRVIVCAAPSAIWHDIDTGLSFNLRSMTVRRLVKGRFVDPPPDLPSL